MTGSHSLLDGDGSVGSMSSDQCLNVSQIGLWATSFEKLIEDPAGLHTFAVRILNCLFLKKKIFCL